MTENSARDVLFDILNNVIELESPEKANQINDNSCPFRSLGLCSEDGMLVTLEVEARLGKDFGDENLFVDGKRKNGKRRTVGQMVTRIEELLKKTEGSNG